MSKPAKNEIIVEKLCLTVRTSWLPFITHGAYGSVAEVDCSEVEFMGR